MNGKHMKPILAKAVQFHNQNECHFFKQSMKSDAYMSQ